MTLQKNFPLPQVNPKDIKQEYIAIASFPSTHQHLCSKDKKYDTEIFMDSSQLNDSGIC